MMLVAQRYDKIVKLVNEHGSMRVTELSERCQVTEETIRRDLDRLERQGLLRRSHGGAVSVQGEQPETPFSEREIMHAEEKRRIAEQAVKLIEPNDRILLDASTTAWYMAASLPDIPLTVLTNSIRVATQLSNREKIEVISTGGQLVSRSLSFVGPLAERSLDTYYVNKLFLSCQGVHLERGVSESNELQGRVKQKMVGMADQVILLADASKFGVQAFAHVMNLNEVDQLITDSRIEQRIVEQLQEQAMKVMIV
ncbi:putative HTH-type transcriptional regulator YulB [Paenibacillus hunanensis]|uniref:DeoR/GlpR family transcriptional regulator of sugar metabolism n=2 Tax=Paenibacillus hunanensis TaxID=539262 RepID=A0ABU1IT97_9BACL|nr:DeoR/GlpR family transcriptional regulator of sugar metabolism [Paenibacillus hunanensis]GGJ08124.1 putative HTH-type transcriptional regulator YulB [Paenibacillus hunanensis]